MTFLAGERRLAASTGGHGLRCPALPPALPNLVRAAVPGERRAGQTCQQSCSSGAARRGTAALPSPANKLFCPSSAPHARVSEPRAPSVSQPGSRGSFAGTGFFPVPTGSLQRGGFVCLREPRDEPGSAGWEDAPRYPGQAAGRAGESSPVCPQGTVPAARSRPDAGVTGAFGVSVKAAAPRQQSVWEPAAGEGRGGKAGLREQRRHV